MENKKNPKYETANKRPLFLATGLLLSLAISFLAFEFKSKPSAVKICDFGIIDSSFIH